MSTGRAPIRVVEQLTRLRERGEAARTVRLSHLVGHLLAFGRVADEETHVARLIVVTAPMDQCDLGLVHVRWSAQQTALAASLSGWIAARVTPDKRVVAPGVDDLDRARQRLSLLGVDWRATADRGAA
jgi:hypothetical protein